MTARKKVQAPEHATDAVEFLESQHREVEDLFEQLEGTSDRATKTRAQLVQKLAFAIEAHAQIEEKVFYPAGRDADEDLTLEAIEEHNVVRFQIEKLLATDTQDEFFMARVTVLKELIEHHVEEEEDEYFPKVSKKLGKKRMAELGVELEEAYAQVEESLQKNPPASRGRSTGAEASV